MRQQKSEKVRQALGTILSALAGHGEITITARVEGKSLRIDVQTDGSTGPRRGTTSAAPTDATAHAIGRSPRRGARSARSRHEEGVVPASARLFSAIERSKIGMGLKELARHFKVSPRTRLKKLLGRLIEAGKVIKVGRRFRATTVTITRGGSRRAAAVRPTAPRAARRPSA